jgi:hypothetical protein
VTADPGARVLAWRGGYVAYGTANGGSRGVVWTSVDGETWSQVTSTTAPQVMVAVSPTGLVAIGGDSSLVTPLQTVWTSSDGVQWQNAGSPTGLGFIDSFAGTSTGLVAVGHPLSSNYATPEYGVVYSADGLSWTPVTVESGLSWNPDYGPQVQSGNNRFFLMVGAKDPASASGKGVIGVVWWSDDGRTWTRSRGTISYPGRTLDFGRDGILLHTRSALIPGGGDGLLLSTDGGKTWQPDDSFGPLGAAACGENHQCVTGPDGVIGSNGTVFLAVKNDGHAWISTDGPNWTPIAWKGPAPDLGTFLVLPRGVVLGNAYGAAK